MELISYRSQLNGGRVESADINQMLQSLVGQQTQIYNIYLRDIGLLFKNASEEYKQDVRVSMFLFMDFREI